MNIFVSILSSSPSSYFFNCILHLSFIIRSYASLSQLLAVFFRSPFALLFLTHRPFLLHSLIHSPFPQHASVTMSVKASVYLASSHPVSRLSPLTVFPYFFCCVDLCLCYYSYSISSSRLSQYFLWLSHIPVSLLLFIYTAFDWECDCSTSVSDCKTRG